MLKHDVTIMSVPSLLLPDGLRGRAEQFYAPGYAHCDEEEHDGRSSATVRPDSHRLRPRVAKRVLVVDDNRDLALSLAMVLRLWGYDVQVAHDGWTALEVAQDFTPDVIFLDIGLPHLNGYEVARRLRQRPELRWTRLIAITGYGCEDARRCSREAGFDLHLTKPVDPLDLRQLLADQ